jgi:hypothetical protein
MKTLVTILSLLVIFLALPAVAKKNKEKNNDNQGAPETTLRILQVDATTLTMARGTAGGEQLVYKLTEATRVTLNGAPATWRDLKAGMEAKVQATPDNTTVLAVDATDAPTHPGKHKVG